MTRRPLSLHRTPREAAIDALLADPSLPLDAYVSLVRMRDELPRDNRATRRAAARKDRRWRHL